VPRFLHQTSFQNSYQDIKVGERIVYANSISNPQHSYMDKYPDMHRELQRWESGQGGRNRMGYVRKEKTILLNDTDH
jgi:hypothetical protein